MNKQFIYPPKTRDDFLHDVVKAMVRRRVELGMTQEDVNYALNVADRLVSKWECGTRTPASFSLYCWADAIGGRIVFLPNGHDTLDIQSSMTPTPANENFISSQTIANDNIEACKNLSNGNSSIVQKNKCEKFL